MAVLSISVVPVGTGTTSISSYVAECHRVLEGVRGIKYELTPMATIIEGDLDTLMEVVRDLHGVPFGRGAKRVLTTIVVDDRRDREVTIEGKVDSVRRRIAG